MTTLRITSLLSFLVALCIWGLFGFLAWSLYGERSDYLSAVSAAHEESARGQSSARLRASVQDTEAERASLDSVLNLSILRAVEILETAGKQAGATDVSIGEATPMSLGATAPKGVTSVSIVVNMQGSFSAVMRAASLYETLMVPSTLENFEMEEVGNAWRGTARVKIYLLADAQ